MSTKVTLLHGKEFHIYTDYGDGSYGYDLHMVVYGKEVKIPLELQQTIKKLVDLHQHSKFMAELTKELDRVDGGVFAFELKKGKDE